MANAIYPKYKQSLLNADANVSLAAGTVKIALVDTGVYTFNTSHQFFSDLSGVDASSPALTTKTITNGVFDADDPTITTVSGASFEALIVYIDTGTTTTSRLVAYIDSGWTGLPATPNGGDIILQFNASGLFAL